MRDGSDKVTRSLQVKGSVFKKEPQFLQTYQHTPLNNSEPQFPDLENTINSYLSCVLHTTFEKTEF